MRYEVNNLERVIYLGTVTRQTDLERSPLGHSIGRFDNGELVVETSDFAYVRWGNGRGVDSGEQKSTLERYALSNDSKALSLTFTMRDPETSRRHLTAGEE